MSLLLVGAAAAAGGPGPNRTQPRRESGRERGGDKPYESRKRSGRGEVEGSGEWKGVAMAMRGSDSDMGMGRRGALDSIRRCINATLSLHYLSLSVLPSSDCLLPAVPRLLLPACSDDLI